ncbi:MAG: hypothetical protein V4448_12860 [Pseudomonadota bacterium]
MIEPLSSPILIWQDEWISPGESLYSALLKIAMVNTLQAAELLRRVFNAPMSHGSSLAVHRRSFLETSWTNKYVADPRLQYIGTLCRHSMMPAGLQIAALSLDKCVRYCPACLSEGVHDPEFQISSLTRCPMHGQALLSSCRFCNAPTPRYAATAATFLSPYRCVECGFYFGGEFDIASLNRRQQRDSSGNRLLPLPLDKLREWLHKASNLSLRWPEGERWQLADLEAEPASQRREIIFGCFCRSLGTPDLASQVFDGDRRYQFFKFFEVRSGKAPWPMKTSEEAANARVKVYKAIRRHIFRKYLKPHQNCLRRPSGGASFGWIDGTSLPDARMCVWGQAWMLWRARFETRFRQECLLRSSGPGDWRGSYAGGIWDGSMTESEWPVLVWLSFHACFRTVYAWAESRWRLVAQGSTTFDHFEFGAVPPPYHQLFAIAHHRLEVQVARLEHARDEFGDTTFLVGADETARLTVLRCVCRPFFPFS